MEKKYFLNLLIEKSTKLFEKYNGYLNFLQHKKSKDMWINKLEKDVNRLRNLNSKALKLRASLKSCPHLDYSKLLKAFQTEYKEIVSSMKSYITNEIVLEASAIHVLGFWKVFRIRANAVLITI